MDDEIALKMAAKNLIGQRFGLLVVSERVGNLPNGSPLWVCRCDCGLRKVTTSGNLVHKGVRSCGCMKNVCDVIHGEGTSETKTKEYIAWSGMISRCEDSNRSTYNVYGGRGITVSEEWRNSYSTFLKEMGRAPSPYYSLDRKNVDGNYCKSNCRWATQIEQARNRRTNVFITHNGETRVLKEWSDILGIPYSKFHPLIKYRKKTIEQIIAIHLKQKTLS
jgi:hypothetical protein